MLSTMIIFVKPRWYFTLQSLFPEVFDLVPDLPFPYGILKLYPCDLPIHIAFVSDLDVSNIDFDLRIHSLPPPPPPPCIIDLPLFSVMFTLSYSRFPLHFDPLVVRCCHITCCHYFCLIVNLLGIF